MREERAFCKRPCPGRERDRCTYNLLYARDDARLALRAGAAVLLLELLKQVLVAEIAPYTFPMFVARRGFLQACVHVGICWVKHNIIRFPAASADRFRSTRHFV